MSVSHESTRGLNSNRFDCAENANNAVLIFIGSCVVFSDRLLRTLKFEFDEVEILRIRDLQELSSLDDQTRIATKLIIFDEVSIGSYLSSKFEMEFISHCANKVLAYNSPQAARNVRQTVLGSGIKSQLRFLPMKSPLDAWLAALRLLLLGEAFVPAELLEQSGEARAIPTEPDEIDGRTAIPKSKAPENIDSISNLTERESQVLKLVAGGLPNKSIADELGLSEHTVKLHVHHIFGKLGVRNRASATNWFLSANEPIEKAEGR